MLEKKCPTCGCVMHIFTEKDKAQMDAAFAKITASENAERAVLDAVRERRLAWGNTIPSHETAVGILKRIWAKDRALAALEKEKGDG